MTQPIPSDEAEFRESIRTWMEEHLTGDFAILRHRGGPGDEHAFVAERMEWERELAGGGWTCVGWPTSSGRGGLPIDLEVAYHEEYAAAGGPGRAGLIGEGLLADLVRFAAPQIQQRFLPGWSRGTDAGVRDTPSQTPGPIWRTSRPKRASKVKSGSSMGRRSGPLSLNGPVGASWCVAPRKVHSVTTVCHTYSSRWTSPASRSGRFVR